jgi:para-nitrobenzyl esterase
MTHEEALSDDIVFTRGGRLRGLRRVGPRGASRAYLGVPYAEPPTGALRLAPPVARTPWDGVFDATRMGATPQRRSLLAETDVPEPSIAGDDILTLNVFAPEAGAGLPVIVWFHGGGFVAGSPASPWYDGREFAADGVVTVVPSYRLGIAGFAAVPGAEPNRGVLDWILALEWVRDNIAAFGGDPDRITIAGQSAGGAAVLALLAAPRAQPLFHQVWAMSGAPTMLTADRAAELARRTAELLGVEPTCEGFLSVDDDSWLEAEGALAAPSGDDPLAPVRELLAEGLPFQPVIDGDLLPFTTIDALHRGIGADKALVLGSAEDEVSAVFTLAGPQLDSLDPAVLLGLLGAPSDLVTEYLAANGDRQGAAAVAGRFFTDSLFRAPIARAARARTPESSTWLYSFAWPSPTKGGAVHCIDIPFFFGVFDAEKVKAMIGPSVPVALRGAVHDAAVAFARSGDPGWPRSVAAGPIRVFDATPHLSSVAYEGVAALIPPSER